MEKKKVTTADAVRVYNILKSVSLKGIEKQHQFAIIRANRAFKAVATAFEDFLKDAQERLKPEGWDEILAKREKLDNLPEEERRAVNRAIESYAGDIQKCISSEEKKEVEVEFEPLSEDAVAAIMSGENDMKAEDMSLVYEVAGAARTT